jgi:nucleotidyltransferase substrate binding protein (TIGR01987 family)
MDIDISPLERVVARLDEGLSRWQRHADDDQLRDGLIQRFEFTYELAHRLLRRYLESVAATPEDVDRLSFPDLIRSASEQGLLLHDWGVWRGYREMRNKTSHTYDEDVAAQVVEGIPAFLEEARALCQTLRQRLK